jgi:hypothetical protein
MGGDDRIVRDHLAFRTPAPATVDNAVNTVESQDS